MYKVTPSSDKNKIEKFLKQVWGDESPIAHVDKPTLVEEVLKLTPVNRVGLSIYDTIENENNEIIATSALKFESVDTIEIGSLAVSKEHRGKGLTSKLFEHLKRTIKKLYGYNYNVVAYATLGSDVINFIIKKMKEITQMPIYVENISLGIAQISTNSLKDNIVHKEFSYLRNGKPFNSTIKILATNNKFYYELPINSTFFSSLSLVLPAQSHMSVSYKQRDNLIINLDPIRLVVYIIRNTDIDYLKKLKRNDAYFTQIYIPLLKEYDAILDYARKNMISTGYSTEEGIIYLTFTLSEPETAYYMNELKNKKYPNEIKEWSNVFSN